MSNEIAHAVNELIERVNQLSAQLEVAFELLEEASLSGQPVNADRVAQLRALAIASVTSSAPVGAPPSSASYVQADADEPTGVARRAVAPAAPVFVQTAAPPASTDEEQLYDHLTQKDRKLNRALDMLDGLGKKK